MCSFAFVDLVNANDKDKVTALDGEMLDGNALKINLAGNKPKWDVTSGTWYIACVPFLVYLCF